MAPPPMGFYDRVTRPDGAVLLSRALSEWTAAYNLPHSSGDPLQDAISDRLARLFPDDFASNLDQDAIWVDLPPGLLHHGELNLLHEPSIFAEPSYDHNICVWAQLVYPSVIARLLAFLMERGIPPSQMDPEQVNAVAAMTAFKYTLQPREMRTNVTYMCSGSCSTLLFKNMPRSLFTSPKRNAGVLFQLNNRAAANQTKFHSAVEGRMYFEAKLARLPVTFDRARFHAGPANSLCLSVARRSIYNEITWNDLRDGVCDVWCTRPQDVRQVVALFESVKGRTRISNSALEYLEIRGMWHASCARGEACCWQDDNPTKELRHELRKPSHERRREYLYSDMYFRNALRQVLTPEQPMPPGTMNWARRHAASLRDPQRALYADWRAARAQHFYQPLS